MTKVLTLFICLFVTIQNSWANDLPFHDLFSAPKSAESSETNMPFWIGINKDYNKVKSHQAFKDVLRNSHCSAATMEAIQKNCGHTFNIGKISAGAEYCVLSPKVNDSIFPPSFLIYNEDKINYVVFDLNDATGKATRYARPVVIEDKIAAGIVEGSIWETFDKNNINPDIASQLSDIFAYTLNFFKVKKGDKFKIMYTEKLVNGESIEIMDVKAVLFNYGGKEYYAFANKNGNKTDYYDEEGKSLKMKFLMAPVKYSRISSKYNTHRLHPVTGVVKGHFGTDFAASQGTPIFATASGVVEEAKFGVYNGNYVKIKHDKVYETQYLHMCRIAKGIRPGRKVSQGEVIGYVGSTGLATGPHVCYRFWKNKKQVDPFREMGAKASFMSKAEQDAFIANIRPVKAELDAFDYTAAHPVLDTFMVKMPMDKDLIVAVEKGK
jgi:murein DD-endopeptidase MepM/ murein hydrolase activator NlpD